MTNFVEILDNNESSIFFLFDIHEGTIFHNKKALSSAIDYIYRIAQERLVIIILGGDLFECITYRDKRFDPATIDQNYNIRDLDNLPKLQAENFIENIKKIKNLIFYYIKGNHEAKFIKYNQYDIYDDIATKIGCKKLGYEAIGNIILKNNNSHSKIIRSAFSHGGGGGGHKEGYAANNIIDIFQKFDCDLHVMGHTHRQEIRNIELITTKKTGEIIRKQKWYGNSGCFVDNTICSEDSYAVGKKWKLQDIGFLEFYSKHTRESWESYLIPHCWKYEKFT